MKKEKVTYRFIRYQGIILYAKKEIPYEIKLSSRLILDELCFNWNKQKLENAIDCSLEEGNKEKFMSLTEAYKHYARN